MYKYNNNCKIITINLNNNYLIFVSAFILRFIQGFML